VASALPPGLQEGRAGRGAAVEVPEGPGRALLEELALALPAGCGVAVEVASEVPDGPGRALLAELSSERVPPAGSGAPNGLGSVSLIGRVVPDGPSLDASEEL
jgi:hypothetical protein